MPSTRRARLAVALSLAAAAAVLPAVVLASPKAGYYIDPQLQVYVQTSNDASVIKSFQAPCFITPQGGGEPTQQGGWILKKHLKISKKGKFSYSGKVKLQSSSTSNIKIKIAGGFKKGKAKGTITYDRASSSCEKTTFSGKYYGKHPQG
jgi:hypothetical protein